MKTDQAGGNLSHIATKILQWLSIHQVREAGYDQGGIYDPLDERVIGDHYAATHFAWGSAILFRKHGDAAWLHRAESAIDFHIRTSLDEYSPGDWDYHWDFNNLAFVETYALARDRLETAERIRWGKSLSAWKNNAHTAVNWIAMRALASYRRYLSLNQPQDLRNAETLLQKILSIQKADGALDDVPGQSRPSQYHAYTACLLYRMMPLSPELISSSLIRAARWLLAVTAPDGDMNALGRGQGQIFGYACAIFLFRAASLLDKDIAPQYLWAADRILEKLLASRHAEGWLPLVVNDLPVTERAGWYDYHHLTVYNAFAAVWLLLAEELSVETEARAPILQSRVVLPDSGILSLRHGRMFSLWTAGEAGHGYACDVGITPHIVCFDGAAVFRYPVGPGQGKYGQNVLHSGQSQNIWSQLVLGADGKWITPSGSSGRIQPVNDNKWLLTYQRGGISWRRELTVGAYFLQAQDRLHLKNEVQASGVRSSNIAIKPEHIEQAGQSAFIVGKNLKLNLWGDGGIARKMASVTAAQGVADVFAVETTQTAQRDFTGGWRLRTAPTLRSKDEKGDEAASQIPGILCLSWDPWSGVWKRKQRLMYEMSRTGKTGDILYVEPPVTGTAVFEGCRQLFSAGETGMRYRRSLCARLMTYSPRFHLFTPFLPLPGQRSYPRIHAWNRGFQMRSVQRKVKKLGMDGYILWLYHPSQIDWLDAFSSRAELIVYDWTDDWVAAFPAHLPAAQKERLARQQEALLQRVDVVFGVSEALCRRAEAFTPWVYHLPNATDIDVFKPCAQGDPDHEIFNNIPAGPRIAYLSQITDRVDFDLIEFLAIKHPDWQFFLIGPVVCPEDMIRPLRRFSNIHLTGALPYKEAAKAVAQADVCILPHKVDALTLTLDPIKLYDYLATGLPVVTTDVAMHSGLKPYVETADSPGNFSCAIEKALKEPKDVREKRRIASRDHVWKERAAEALDFLDRFFR